MKKLILNLSLAVLAFNAVGQAPTPAPPAATPAATIDPVASGNKGSAIGFNLSTDGVGLQFAQNLSAKKNLAIRVGGMYLPYSVNNLEQTFSGTTLVLNGDVKLGAVQALFDFHPFNNAFKLTGGVAYMLTNVAVTGKVKDSVAQGQIMLAPDEIGKINVGVDLGPICPYVGFGLGRAVPKSRFSFNFELGAYYINQPKITFEATGMLEPSSVNEKVLQDNVSEMKWLPMMNFGFNFKIGK